MLDFFLHLEVRFCVNILLLAAGSQGIDTSAPTTEASANSGKPATSADVIESDVIDSQQTTDVTEADLVDDQQTADVIIEEEVLIDEQTTVVEPETDITSFPGAAWVQSCLWQLRDPICSPPCAAGLRMPVTPSCRYSPLPIRSTTLSRAFTPLRLPNRPRRAWSWIKAADHGPRNLV